MKYILSSLTIVFVVLASVAMIAFGANTEQTYLPWVTKSLDYPVNGWVITSLWVINGETFAQLENNGWVVNGKCIDSAYPAPPVGTSCQLFDGIFYCSGSSQRFTLIELIVIPTITPTPTQLPTETPGITPSPPTGITSTPTPVP